MRTSSGRDVCDEEIRRVLVPPYAMSVPGITRRAKDRGACLVRVFQLAVLPEHLAAAQRTDVSAGSRK
eukprot:1535561-Rhodomonas_salina.6